MSTRRIQTTLRFGGGWAPDYGPTYGSPPQNGELILPYLAQAENVYYELDGSPRKIGGTRNVVQPTAGNAQEIIGASEYWIQEASTETQWFVARTESTYRAAKHGNSWATGQILKSGLQNGVVPCMAVFNGDLIMTTTSTVDVPQKWDGLTATSEDLGGSPPNFDFHVSHRNRLWAVLGSRVYYTAALDSEDWAGATAGSFDVEPDDGDRVTGIASHRGELVIFKGPNLLSIHRLTGSAPTGEDAFALTPLVTGVGATNHNSIVRIGTDLVFPSPKGIHSLQATAAYGDFVEHFLSHPILTFYQNEVSQARLPYSWGVNNQRRGQAIWLMNDRTASGGPQHPKEIGLIYDYRFQPGRWSLLTNYDQLTCLLSGQDTSRRHKLMAGASGGTLVELDADNRSIAPRFGHPLAMPYTGQVRTPALNFGVTGTLKNAEEGFISVIPHGGSAISLGYVRDSKPETHVTLNQTSRDVLGSTFILGHSLLGGGPFKTSEFGMKGEFREIQFRLHQPVLDGDMAPKLIEFHYQLAGVSAENR